MGLNGKRSPSNRAGKSAGIRKGRFEKGMDPLFSSFNASISYDKRLFAEDIQGSMAHAGMLASQGIISPDAGKAIIKGLESLLKELEQGKLELREDLEDVHINIEEFLREKIGDTAGRLHTARSRNDQVALDLRLYLKKRITVISANLCSLLESLVNQAEDHLDSIMPGYTHLQRAQPVRLAHHLLAYYQMFRRDLTRFRDALSRMDEMPLGSAALAGTTFEIDRQSAAETLGFSRVTQNSMDSVSDRDFAAEFVFDCSMVMMHLSRLSEELIIWSTSEFAFCALPDAFCSGSSIMPQKKNPDACELIRGKTGRVYGSLIAIMTMLKALPLAYNKDMQEDKEAVFDASDTTAVSVEIMARLVSEITFDEERMLDAASDPSLAATDLADKMVREGMPFRQAHSRVGKIMRELEGKKSAEQSGLVLPSPEEMVESRDHVGGTSRKRVSEQIQAARDFLESQRAPIEEKKTVIKGKRKG